MRIYGHGLRLYVAPRSPIRMDDHLARLRIERGAKPEVSRGATRRRLGRYALGAIAALPDMSANVAIQGP